MNKRVCSIHDERKYYQIGTFAQWNRTTVKTLRYYDDIDLLKPEYIDETSGYRYYTSNQLPIFHHIQAMRHMGFSLNEIKQILAGESKQSLLYKKKNDCLKQIADLTQKVAYIDGYLSGSFSSEYHVIIKSLPQVIVASMRVHLQSYDALFDKMPDMGKEMELAGCACAEPDYCFTRYFDGEYKETDINAEVCQAVVCAKADREHLTFQVLPEVPLAACVLHKGPYETFPLAYAAAIRFIEESGYEITDYQRESYIDGVWNKDCESQWLSELQFPIGKRR